jgi:integrase
MSTDSFAVRSEEFLAYASIYAKTRRTIQSNVRILKKHFGERRVIDIGPKEIMAFIAARLAEGVGKPTINRNRSCLSVFFAWAKEQGYHPGPNPVRAVRKFKESPGRLRYLTTDEFSRLLMASAYHLKKVLVGAVHTGGRLKELLGLRWGDIDLEHGIVYFRADITKSGKERVVPISPELDVMLRELRPGRPAEPVFEYAGRQLKSVRTGFESARLKAGLGNDVVFHTLRHTFASWYIENGGDPKRLQEYMGHSSLEQTLIYIHLSPLFRSQGVQFIGPPRIRRVEDTPEE